MNNIMTFVAWLIQEAQWMFGVVIGYWLARVGSRKDFKRQIQEQRRKLFSSYIDEISGHDWQTEFLLRTPDDVRRLETPVWQQVKCSGELWAMDEDAQKHIVVYGERVERYNHHQEELDWLKREILDHPNQALLDYVNRTQKKLLEMRQDMCDLQRNTAFEVRWWMRKEGLLGERKWKQWLKTWQGKQEPAKAA